MSAPTRFFDLSATWQVLVRLCQSIDYGQIVGLHIRGGQPVFDPPPTVIVDVKLDSDHLSRPENELDDFALCEEFRRLIQKIQQLDQGRVDRVDVRAGLPRRMLIERQVAEAPL
jgi:hypothetical protein